MGAYFFAIEITGEMPVINVDLSIDLVVLLFGLLC